MTNEENNGEINITSYIQTVSRSWRFILVGTLLIVALSGGYYRYSPQRYEIKTQVQLGLINDQLSANSSKIVSKATNKTYSTIVSEKTGFSELKFLPVKAIFFSDTNLLTLSIKYTDLSKGRMFLKEIAQIIINEEKEATSNHKIIQEERINLIESAIKLSQNKQELLREAIIGASEQARILENQIVNISRLNLENNNLDKQLALLNANALLNSYRQKITDYRLEEILIEESLYRLKSDLIDLKIANNKIIEPMILKISDDYFPLRPKMIIVLIIAIILGLFLGSLCVLINSWWKGAKKLTLTN